MASPTSAILHGAFGVLLAGSCAPKPANSADAPAVDAAPEPPVRTSRVAAMRRGDWSASDAAAMDALFEQDLSDRDFILPMVRSGTMPSAIPAMQLATYSGPILGNSSLATTIAAISGAWIVYDPECFAGTPGQDPCTNGQTFCATTTQDNPGDTEHLNDYCHYTDAVTALAQAVHDAGKQLMLTPLAGDVTRYSASVAPVVDAQNLQIPPCPATADYASYAATVNTAAISIKAANPSTIVLTQLIPRLCTAAMQKQNSSDGVAEAIKAWHAVRDEVDGVWFYSFAQPSPVAPMLAPFFEAL